MQTSEQTDKIYAALALAQAQTAPAVKDSTNPAFRSKYADLTAHMDAIRPAAKAAQIAVLQDLTSSDVGVSVVTRLAHASGQWVEFGPLFIPANKHDAQGFGSAASYARRYALSAAWGTVADDDDGNAAVQSAPARAVNVHTGEVTTADKADAPAGYHYISGYRQNGEWHEASLLKWDAQGGALKVSTKKASVGARLAQYAKDGVPVKADVTAKKNSPGEAYLNDLHAYTATERTPPPPLTDDIDESSIPF
jgi:hypothetical protein